MAKGWPKGKPRNPRTAEQAIEPQDEICGNCALLLYRDPWGRGLCERTRKPKEPNDERCSAFHGHNQQTENAPVKPPEEKKDFMMKMYISGKITGLPADEVEAKFAQAAQQIRAFGHEAVSPLKNGLNMAEEWNKHIVADIALLLECDAIYQLGDWRDSKGARIEANIAQECGIKIILQPEYAAYRK